MIRSIEKLFSILECLDRTRWTPLVRISRSVELPKATVCNQLKTLECLGYIENNGSGSYRLSGKFSRLGVERVPVDELEQLALDVCMELAARTGESAVIAVLNNSRISIAAQARHEQSFMVNLSVYRDLSFWRSTSGRVLLAYQSREELAKLIRRIGFPGTQWNDICDLDTLEENLRPVRNSGLAVMVNEKEHFTAWSCPFFDGAGVLCGAVGMTVPHQRLEGRDEFMISELRRAAGVLEKQNLLAHFTAADWRMQ